MNQTRITEFYLLGFKNLHTFYYVLIVPLFCVYILAVIMNFLIILLVAKTPSLRSPMYFFLGHLSWSDIVLITNISPNMFHILINGGGRISFTGCVTQLYFHGISATFECLLLTVMSYDRYVAICKPLHYVAIMNPKLCLLLVVWSWFIACMNMITLVSLVCSLPYCGPQVIDHYFCDIAPIVDLSCSDHAIVDHTYFTTSTCFTVVPFSFILFTYISIFFSISRITSTGGKQKAFSTCSSHLIVVSMYYGTIMAIYVAPPSGQSSWVSKVISLLYTMGIPLFNPIIYSLRNREIKTAILKYIFNKNCCFSAWKWQENRKKLNNS